MERLLALIGPANDDKTLAQVTADTWFEARYSLEASDRAKILAEYSEFAHCTIRELKERFELPF